MRGIIDGIPGIPGAIISEGIIVGAVLGMLAHVGRLLSLGELESGGPRGDR